jgi:hypothetical protein
MGLYLPIRPLVRSGLGRFIQSDTIVPGIDTRSAEPVFTAEHPDEITTRRRLHDPRADGWKQGYSYYKFQPPTVSGHGFSKIKFTWLRSFQLSRDIL